MQSCQRPLLSASGNDCVPTSRPLPVVAWVRCHVIGADEDESGTAYRKILLTNGAASQLIVSGMRLFEPTRPPEKVAVGYATSRTPSVGSPSSRFTTLGSFSFSDPKLK